jgi:hypothetical protein
MIAHDERIIAVVAGWDIEAVKKQAQYLGDELGLNAMYYIKYEYEAKVINEAIETCKFYGGSTAKYMWYVEPDVDVSRFPDTPGVMASYLDNNPSTALIRPNREGEDPISRVYKKYLDDGTAWMFRLSSPVRWDPDFIYTGWGDLDFSNAIEHEHELPTLYELRSVVKRFTSYGSWSTYRNAYGARNRLLLEAKWYWVGIEDWMGVDHYNAEIAAHHERIPGAIELAGWSEEMHNQFVASVDLEHPQIRIPQKGHPGNVGWHIPWEEENG